jgi:hypothetical protein
MARYLKCLKRRSDIVRIGSIWISETVRDRSLRSKMQYPIQLRWIFFPIAIRKHRGTGKEIQRNYAMTGTRKGTRNIASDKTTISCNTYFYTRPNMLNYSTHFNPAKTILQSIQW